MKNIKRINRATIPMATQSEQLQVKANDEDLKGRYANAMQVSHDKDEFLLDFLLLKPTVLPIRKARAWDQITS